MECSILCNKYEHEHTQKKTFTKWINHLLSKKTPTDQIQNLYSDLCDGIRLLEIMEILTKKKLSIERQKQMNRVHCLTNVSSLIGFLTFQFHLKLININATDIVDGKPNIILGLIWQIILNFQIKDEALFKILSQQDNNPIRRQSLTNGTPTEALLAWSDQVISEKYGISIQDFHKSWRDGLAFSAMIHNIDPNLVDLNLIKRRNSKENLECAFQIAEEYLNIPKLLEPEDVDVEDPDEKCIMTYLSQFLHNYPYQDPGEIEENEELKGKYEQCLGQIKILLSDIESSLLTFDQRPTLSTEEEMIMFLPIIDKMSKSKTIQKKMPNIQNDDNIKSGNLPEQRKIIEKDCQQKSILILQQQWNMEMRISEDETLCNFFQPLQTLEKAVIFLFDLSMESITNCDKSFIHNVKAANSEFHTNMSHIFKEVDGKIPILYIENIKDRTNIVEEEVPRIRAYFEFIDLFQNLSNENKDLQCQIESWKTTFPSFQYAIIKYEELKDYIQSEKLKSVKNQLNKISSSFSHLSKGFLNKNITHQMVVNQCYKKLSDSITVSVKDIEETLSYHKCLIENWKSLEEKKDDILKWVTYAKDIIDEGSNKVEDFFTKESQWSMSYQNYSNEKDKFSHLNQESSKTIKNEFDTITNIWQCLLSSLETLRQENKICDLKKEYDERIQRIEVWMNKSETIVNRKPECNSLQLQEYMEILEVAVRNFETVKTDLQKATKIGETMFKTNLAEEGIEEILGTLQVDKERFLNVREKVNTKAKKLRKILPFLYIFEKNVQDLSQWIQSAHDLLLNSFDAVKEDHNCGDHDNDNEDNELKADKWLEGFQRIFNDNDKLKHQSKISDNLKIVQRISTKLNDDVDNGGNEKAMQDILDKFQKCFVDSSSRKYEMQFCQVKSKLKKMLEDVKRKLKTEESDIKSEKDFPKVLDDHQAYFGNHKVKNECIDLMASMKTLNQFINCDAEKNPGECDLNAVEQLEEDMESVFKTAEDLKDSFCSIPEQLSVFRNKIAEIEDWLSSMDQLSSELDISDENLKSEDYFFRNNSQTCESQAFKDYEETLAKFEHLYKLANVQTVNGEDLIHMLSDIKSVTPQFLLVEEENQLQNAINKFENISTKIEETAKTAPIVVKSLKSKDNAVKLNERLLQLQMEFDNFDDEETVEMENIEEEEQKIMKLFEKETEEISKEIAKHEDITLQLRAMNMVSLIPNDLGNAFEMVEDAKRRRLEKLKETKKFYQKIEENENNIEREIEEVSNILSSINEGKDYDENMDSSIEKLDSLLGRVENGVERDVNNFANILKDYERKVNSAKAEEIERKAEIYKLSVEEIKEIVKNKRNNRAFKREMLRKSFELVLDFENDLTKKSEVVKIVQKELESIMEDEGILQNLASMSEQMRYNESCKEGILDEITKSDMGDSEELIRKVQDIFAESSRKSQDLLSIIVESELKIKNNQEDLNNVKELSAKFDDELNDILEDLQASRPERLIQSQWNDDMLMENLQTIKSKFEQCQQNTLGNLKQYDEHLFCSNEGINQKLNDLTNKAQSIEKIIEDEQQTIQEGIEFSARNLDFLEETQTKVEIINDSLKNIKLRKEKVIGDYNISGIEAIKIDILSLLHSLDNQEASIDSKTEIFSCAVIEEMKAKLNVQKLKLENYLEMCQQMSEDEVKNKDVLSRKDMILVEDEIQPIENKAKITFIDVRVRKTPEDDIKTNIDHSENIILKVFSDELPSLNEQKKEENIMMENQDKVQELDEDEEICHELPPLTEQMKNENIMMENQGEVQELEEDEENSDELPSSNGQEKDENIMMEIQGVLQELEEDEEIRDELPLLNEKKKNEKIMKENQDKVQELEEGWESNDNIVNDIVNCNQWSIDVYNELKAIIKDLKDQDEKLDSISENDLHTIQYNVGVMKKKLEKTKESLKQKNESYPIVNGNNSLKLINLYECVDEVEEQIRESSNRLKNAMKESKDREDLESRISSVKQTILDNNKSMNSIVNSDTDLVAVQSVQKELSFIGLVVYPLKEDIDEISQEALKRNQNFNSQATIEELKEDYNNLSDRLSEKIDFCNDLKRYTNESQACLSHISVSIDKLKEVSEAKMVFLNCSDMLSYMKISQNDFLENVEIINETLNTIDMKLEIIEEKNEIFPGLNCTGMIIEKEKLKKEFLECLPFWEVFVESLKDEIDKAENIENRISQLDCDVNNCISSLKDLANSQMPTESMMLNAEKGESRLKDIQKNYENLCNSLNDSFTFFDSKVCREKVNTTITISEKGLELVKCLKENSEKITKEIQSLGCEFEDTCSCLDDISNNVKKFEKDHSDNIEIDVVSIKVSENELKRLKEEIENFEKKLDNLPYQNNNEDIKSIISKKSVIKEKSKELSNRIDTIKKDLYEDQLQRFRKAKDEHEKWMATVESRLKVTENLESHPTDVELNLQSLNALISSIENEEKLIQNICQQSQVCRQLETFANDSNDEELKCLNETLQQQFHSIVNDILKSREKLENASNKTSEQRATINLIEQNHLRNKRKLSILSNKENLDLDAQKRNLTDLEKIEEESAKDLQYLLEIESQVTDLSLKKDLESLVESHQKFNNDTKSSIGQLSKNIKINDILFNELFGMKNNIKAQIERSKLLANSNDPWNENRIKELEEQSKDLKKFKDEMVNQLDQGLDQTRIFSDKNLFPSNMSLLMEDVQVDIQALNRHISVIENDLKEYKSKFSEWNNAFNEAEDLLILIDKSIDEESHLCENIIEKEEKYNLCLKNKQDLENLKVKINHLVNVNSQLKGDDQDNCQLDQICEKQKMLSRQNLKNLNENQQILQHHKTYDSKVDSFKSTLNSLALDTVDRATSEPLKGILKEAKQRKVKLIDVKNRLKNLENEKNLVCKETSATGQNVINFDYMELTEDINKLSLTLDEEIENYSLQMKSHEAGSQVLKAMKKWMIENKNLEKLSKDTDIETKLNKMESLSSMIDSKFDILKDFNVFMLKDPFEPAELHSLKNNVQSELGTLKEETEQMIKDLRVVQNLLAENQGIIKDVTEKQNQIKSQIDGKGIIFDINALDSELESFNMVSEEILKLDRDIENCMEIVQKVSKCKSGISFVKSMNVEIKKLEKNQSDYKNKVKEKISTLKNNKVKVISFQNSFIIVDGWMNEQQKVYQCIISVENLEERIDKLKNLRNEIIRNKPNLNNLELLANNTCTPSCQELTGNLLIQYGNILKDIERNLTLSTNQMDIFNYYFQSLNTLDEEIDLNILKFQELRSNTSEDVDQLVGVTRQASLILNKSTNLQNKIGFLEEEIRQKDSALLKCPELNQKFETMGEKIKNLLVDLKYFIDNCDKEKKLLVESNKKMFELRKSVNSKTLDVANMERCKLYDQSSLMTIQDLTSKVLEDKNVFENIKAESSSSRFLQKSPKFNTSLQNIQQNLEELSEKSGRLYEKLNDQILKGDTVSNVEMIFADQLQNIEGEIDKLRKDIVHENYLDVLNKKNKRLHDLQENLSDILRTKIDKSSDKYSHLSTNHRNRNKQLQKIDDKIYQFSQKLKQEKENTAKYNTEIRSLEDNVKQIEFKLVSLDKQSDMGGLEEDEYILRKLFFDCETVHRKLTDTKSEIDNTSNKLNLKFWSQSIGQLNQKIDSVKTRIRERLRQIENTKENIKDHQITMDMGKSFIRRCQEKFSRTEGEEESLYQIQHALEEKKEMLLLVQETEKQMILGDAEKVWLKFPCLSEEAVQQIQNDIEKIGKEFESMEIVIKTSKNILENKLTKVKEKEKLLKDFEKWLKRKENIILVMDKVENESDIDEKRKILETVLTELIGKEERVTSEFDNYWDSPYFNLKERCRNLISTINTKLEFLDRIALDFDNFNKVVREWNSWCEIIISKRSQIRPSEDYISKDIIQLFLGEKEEKFETILTITSKGEALLPALTVEGRKRLESIIKVSTDKWHDIFDDIPILVEMSEINCCLEKKTSHLEQIDIIRLRLGQIQESLFQIIILDDPLKIRFPVGLSNKRLQMQNLSDLKQECNILSYRIERMGNQVGNHENDDKILNDDVLKNQLNALKDLIDKVKLLDWESYRNHKLFEIILLQIEDHFIVKKITISQCENMDGTMNSIKARMTKIEELMTENEPSFNYLIKAYEEALTSSGSIEQKVLKDRFESIVKEKTTLETRLSSTYSSLETVYKILERFQIKYDALLKDLDKLKQQTFDNHFIYDFDVFNKIWDNFQSLFNEGNNLRRWAVEIQQNSKNTYPVKLTNVFQDQLTEIKSVMENYCFDQDELRQLKNQYKIEKESLSNLIDNIQAKQASIVKNVFEECSEFSVLERNARNIDEISGEKHELDLRLSSLRIIFQRLITFFPQQHKEEKEQYSILLDKYERFSQDFRELDSRLRNICQDYEEVDNKINDVQHELCQIEDSKNSVIPLEKPLKNDRIKELIKEKSHLILLKDRLNEISVDPLFVSPSLRQCLVNNKLCQQNLTDTFLNDIDRQLTNLRQSVEDQEQLEDQIETIKDALHCVNLFNDDISQRNVLNRIDIENKINETDENISLLGTFKSNLKEILNQNKQGCDGELEKLKLLQKERHVVEEKCKSVKSQLERDIETINELEDHIYKICKVKEEFGEKIKNLIGWEISESTNQKEMLAKSNELKREIVKIEEKFKEMENKIVKKISGNICTKTQFAVIDRLKEDIDKQKEKITKIIEHRKMFILAEENFNKLYSNISSKIEHQKKRLQSSQVPCATLKQINLVEINEMIMKLEEHSFLCNAGKNVISGKLKQVEGYWEELQFVSNQLKWEAYRKELKSLDLDKRSEKLKIWWTDIQSSLEAIIATKSNNARERKQKHVAISGIEAEVKEWKTEMDLQMSSMKTFPDDNINVEMSINAVKLMDKINGLSVESKLEIEMQTEFDNIMKEFDTWMTMMENNISGSELKYEFSLESINWEIDLYNSLHHQLTDGESKISLLETAADKLFVHTPSKGQQNIGDQLKTCREKYKELQVQLEQKIKVSEYEKHLIQEFWLKIEEFRSWLLKEEKDLTSDRQCMLPSLNAKELTMTKYQSSLLSIKNQKTKLDTLTENGNTFLLTFSLRKVIKDLSTKYMNLKVSTESHIKTLTKMICNHHNYNDQYHLFQDMTMSFDKDFQLLKLQSLRKLSDEIEIMENKLMKINNFKSDLQRCLQKVFGETDEEGKKLLTNQYDEVVKTHEDVVKSYDQFKMSFFSHRTFEKRMIKNFNDQTMWLDSLDEIIKDDNLRSHTGSPVIQSFLNKIGKLYEELESREMTCNELSNDYNTMEDKSLEQSMLALKDKFESVSKSLDGKRSFLTSLLDSNERYLTSLDAFNKWYTVTNAKIRCLLNGFKSSQIVYDLWSEKLQKISICVKSEGKQLLDSVLENADLLNKRLIGEREKTKLNYQIKTVKDDFFKLTNKIETTTTAISDVFGHLENFTSKVNYFEKTFTDFEFHQMKLKSVEYNYANSVDEEIKTWNNFVKDIIREKRNLDEYICQMKTKDELSQNIEMDIVLEDLFDKFDIQEIESKVRIESLSGIQIDKESFESQCNLTKSEVNKIKKEILRLDETKSKNTLKEFLVTFSEFQLLDSKVINGSRMMGDLECASLKLFLTFDQDKLLKRMTAKIKTQWNGLENLNDEVKTKMIRLLNLWLHIDSLRFQTEKWIDDANFQFGLIRREGYQDSEMALENVQKLKNLLLESEEIKPKLSKYIELSFQADSYSSFPKSTDPLVLQQKFCDSLDKIEKINLELVTMQSKTEILLHDFLETEKWILNTSLFINEQSGKVQNINKLSELKDQIKLSKDLELQIGNCEKNIIPVLVEKFEDIIKSFAKSSRLKVDISEKIIIIDQSIRQLRLINEKFKKQIKERYNIVREFQEIIEKIEFYLYRELNEWWTNNGEITKTLSPKDCQSQIEESFTILENLKLLKYEFERVWQDCIRQINDSQSLLSDSSEYKPETDVCILFDNTHQNQIRNKLKECKEKVEKRLIILQDHKLQWDHIEMEINELSNLFDGQSIRLGKMILQLKKNEFLIDIFEKLLTEMISKKERTEIINNQIRDLQNNNVVHYNFGLPHYTKNFNLCQKYYDLLNEMDAIHKDFKGIEIQVLFQETVSDGLCKNFKQNVHESDILTIHSQRSTQTNRNKSTNIQKINKNVSIPNLTEFSNKNIQTLMESNKTFQEDKNKQLSHKTSQTLKDTRSKSVQQCSDFCHQSDYVDSINQYSSKEKQMKRLLELLVIIKDIKRDIVVSNRNTSLQSCQILYSRSDNPLRHSLESVRHNLISTKKNGLDLLKNLKMYKSFESLTFEPSVIGYEYQKSLTQNSKRYPGKSRKMTKKVNLR